jgi:hypothetical protein
MFFLYSAVERKSNAYRKMILTGVGLLVALGFSVNYLFSFLSLASYLAFIISKRFSGTSIRDLLIFSFCVLVGFVVGTLLIYSYYLLDLIKGGDQLYQYLSDQSKFLAAYGYPLNKRLIIDRLFDWIVPFSPLLIAAAMTSRKEKTGFVFLFCFFSFGASVLAASFSLAFFPHYWIYATLPLAVCSAYAIRFSNGPGIAALTQYAVLTSLLIYMVSGSERLINHHTNNAEARDFHGALTYAKKVSPEPVKAVFIQTTSAYAYLNRNLVTDQKFIFRNHVPRLTSAGVLDGSNYYLNLLKKSPEVVVLGGGYCDEPIETYLREVCPYIASNFRLGKTFEGRYPVEFYFSEKKQSAAIY